MSIVYVSMPNVILRTCDCEIGIRRVQYIVEGGGIRISI